MDCGSLTAVTQEKCLLHSYVLTCSVVLLDILSFSFFPSFPTSSVVVVDFIGTMKSN